MLPNAYTLGPPPTLPCPHCLRYFRTKSGRTRHITIHLANESEHPEPHAPDTAASPIPSLELSYHDRSPVPPHFTPSLSPSLDEFNADPNFDIDIEHPRSNASRASASPIPSLSPPPCDGFNADPNIDMDIEHPHPNPPRITRVFHPKLNGMSFFLKK